MTEILKTELQKFHITDAAIAAARDQCMSLTIRDIEDVDGYKKVHAARMVIKDHRVRIEKKRKELKADALTYGQAVDGEARRITAQLEPIESHLLTEEKRIDDEKERIRNAARVEAEEKARKEAETEAARIQAEEEAERARIKAEQDTENERLQAERKELAAAQATLDEERQKVEAERQRLANIETARQREIENDRIRKEAADTAQRETEERIAREAAVEKAKVDAAEAARLRAESLKPDREKLLTVVIALQAIEIPGVSSEAAKTANNVAEIIGHAAEEIRELVNDQL